MLTNETRRELLNRVRSTGYPGGIAEVFQAADQGIDLIDQYQMQQEQEQMQVASTPQEQEIGLREQHAMGNTQTSMAFPDVQPNQSFNTVGMKAPIDIQKIDNQGHLVESYKNVPPGIQDLPTGPAEGTIIESPAAYQKGGLRRKRGYVQKYQTAGFDMSGFNMEPPTAISDNTRVVNNQAIIESNEIEKDAEFYNQLLANYNASDKTKTIPTPAQRQVLASGNYIGSRAIVNKANQIPVREDKLIDVNKRNAALISSNSMLTNQLAGGHGGSNMRKAIEANPEKTEEIYRNINKASGQNTMKWLGLGVLTAGAGAGAGGVKPGFGGATNYINYMSKGVDLMSKANRIRPWVKGALQTGYNATKLAALPTFYNQTGNFGVDLATGNYDNLQKRTMDFGRGVVSNHPALRKMKDAYKMGQDAWEGNYADVLTRGVALGSRSPGIGKGLEYYGTKTAGKFLPDSWQNLGGLPSIKSLVNRYTKPKPTVDLLPPIKGG